MKYLCFLFLPLQLFSQNIAGLWIGTIYNDSTQKTLHYEVAISENNGKLAGYSYTTFIIDNIEAIGVKSLKIVKQKDKYFFEDVDLLFNNYPVPPPKGVRQISALTFSETDSLKVLSGKFITTRTRQFGRQVTGTLRLEKRKEYSQAKLIDKLNTLGLSNTLSFLSKEDIVAMTTTPPVLDKQEKKPAVFVPAIPPKPVDVLAELSRRKIETIETVSFSEDSLMLSLYDNGYVDGDSVSLVVNGKVLLQHQQLSTQAIVKTIKAPAGIVDSLNIVMYAENLGSIAPNTGLLVIDDGEKRHEISFSGDLKKNAAIVLKRRKK